MPEIHPTAVVHPDARLADDVVVGPFCQVGGQVTIGVGTRLIAQVHVCGRTTIGQRNTVWPQTVLGGDPQDLKFKGEDSELIIGDENVIRECVTIHKGTDNDNGQTVVGDHNLIMCYVHIGHDCILGDHIVIANGVQLAGHVRLEGHSNLGGASAVHHFCTIGQFSYVGGMTRVVHDVPPYMVVEGNPSRVRKVNTTLLKRHDFTEAQVDHLKKAYRLLFARHDDGSIGAGTTLEILAQLESDHPHDPTIQTLVAAIQRSADGVHGRYRESLRRDNPYANPVQ